MNRKDTETSLLRFALQWKSNPLEKNVIGLWVMEDTSLDSAAFKSYVVRQTGHFKT